MDRPSEGSRGRDKKIVTISLTAVVDEEITPERIADAVGEALGPLSRRVDNFSEVDVRTVPRDMVPGGSDELRPIDGYETRLWSKVTC